MCPLDLRQLCNTVSECLFCAGPHASSLAILELQKTREEQARVLVASLAGNHGWQMVNRNDAQLRALELGRGRDGGAVKGAVARVDGNRVVLAVGVAADVADDAEAPLGRRQRLERGKGRDAVGAQVHAVDEDVGRGDFGKGPALGGLGQIPLDERLGGDAGGVARGGGTVAAAAQRADDHEARVLVLVERQRLGNGRADERHQVRGRVKGRDRRLRDAGVQQLVRPGQQGEGRASVASAPAKSGHALALFVDEEFKVVEDAVALSEAGQLGGPSILLLEAVVEVDIAVWQRR